MAAPRLEQWRNGFDAQPLNRALGIRADEIGEGFVQLRVVRVPGSTGGIDGVTDDDAARVSTFAISTAADLAVVSATGTTINRLGETMNGTAELNLTYVALPQGEAIVRGTVLHRAPTFAVVELRVTDDGGAPVAYGRGTYVVRPPAAQQAAP